MTVSALKRKTVPRNGLQYYLAVSHGYDQHGWRLRPVPSNYELRYICKKGSIRLFRLIGDRYVALLVGVCNRSQMKTSKCTRLIFGVSIGLDTG